jgi:transcriptional antiterminator NusG
VNNRLFAIPTTTALVRANGERIKGEWAVEVQMQEIGCKIYDSRTVEFIRKGKDRFARPEYRPALPGYVFADIPYDLFGRAVHVKGAWGSALPIYQVEKRNKLKETPHDAAMRFFASLEEKRVEAERIKSRADLVAEFDPGEPLNIISGPFAELLADFRRMVKTAHDRFPMIEAQMEIMGQKTTVKIDPLDVAKRA